MWEIECLNTKFPVPRPTLPEVGYNVNLKKYLKQIIKVTNTKVFYVIERNIFACEAVTLYKDIYVRFIKRKSRYKYLIQIFVVSNIQRKIYFLKENFWIETVLSITIEKEVNNTSEFRNNIFFSIIYCLLSQFLY